MTALPRFNDRFIYLNREPVNSHFYLNATGISYPHKNYAIEHYKYHYAFQFIVSGKGYIKCDGVVKELNKGDFFYIGAVEGVSYWTDSEVPFTKISFCGSGSFFDCVEAVFGFETPFDVVHTDSSHNVSYYFHRIFDEAKIVEDPPEKVMSTVLELAGVIRKIKNGQDFQTKAEDKVESGGMAKELSKYVAENLSYNLTLGSIALHFGITTRTVHNYFFENFGMSPKKYIRMKRLESARELLSGTNMAISLIAEQAGFKDCAYFCKVFREQFGVSPGEYRKSLE